MYGATRARLDLRSRRVTCAASPLILTVPSGKAQHFPGAVEIVTEPRGAMGRGSPPNCSRSGRCSQSSTAEPHRGRSLVEILTPFDLVGGEVKRSDRFPYWLSVPKTSPRCWRIPVILPLHSNAGRKQRPSLSESTSTSVMSGYEQPHAASSSAAFAVNLDSRFPVAPGLFDPGCGALAAAIAVAGGAQPVAIGKPEPTLFRVAIERLGCPGRQAAMIGDSQSSDIQGGRKAGMFTVWLDPGE